jgi:transcriptional regulator with XRE-family HTH domain
MSKFSGKTEQQILEIIGRSIRGSRIGQELTLKELASISEISEMTLSRIENGKTNPTILTLFRIFKSLNREKEIEKIFPEPNKSPLIMSKQAKSKNHETLPQRVRKKKENEEDEEWSWEE